MQWGRMVQTDLFDKLPPNTHFDFEQEVKPSPQAIMVLQHGDVQLKIGHIHQILLLVALGKEDDQKIIEKKWLDEVKKRHKLWT